MSDNHLFILKLGLILGLLQRSVTLLASERAAHPHPLPCFFSKRSKTESNFRSIREFEAGTPYLQPRIASDPMQ